MQYDVFISYSRKDSSEVHKLIDLLRREIPEIKIWYDIDGIETAEAFRSKIIRAIDQSNFVLFACSDSSLASEYCEKEVMYAHRKKKTIIPYLLSGMELDGWLLFEFGNINCINASKEDEVNRMIRDLKKWVEKDKISQNHESANTNINVQQAESNPRIGETKSQTVANSESEIKTNGNFINGHEYVDLGLPSGLKWATCNVGASQPDEYGDYFAWGEVNPKSYYTPENSKTYDKDIQWLKENRYLDNNDNLTLANDAARQNWGGTWRMPTVDEIYELYNNTTYKWTTINNIRGCLLKSNLNDNSIFIAAGGMKYGSTLDIVAETGYLWSSSRDIYNGDERFSSHYGVDSEGLYICEARRYLAFSVRPVSE